MRLARIASSILIGAAGMVAVFLGRALLLLRQLLAHGSPELARLWLVAGALLAILLLLLRAVRLRPARRVNVALSVASVLLTLYAAELTLAAREPGRRKLRDKLAVMARMSAGGTEPSPGVEPVRFVWSHEPGSPSSVLLDGVPALPLAGISRRTTLDCKEGGDWLVYRTDEHGFHNPPGLWGAGAVELAFLGDSFVHGSCVPSEDNMVARVRERHPATLNLGTAGGGPLTMLAQLREYLPALRPRTVLWCHFSGNDLLDLRRESRHPLLTRYLEDGYGQGLLARQPALDRALEGYVGATLLPAVRRRAGASVDLPSVLALRELRTAAGLALADPYALAPSEAEYLLFERVLGGARRTVEGWGGRLVFVSLPAWEAPPRQLGEAEYARVKRDSALRTRRIVAGLGLPIVDVEARFAAHPDPRSLYACPGCHYGPAGYALAARAVLDWLDGGGR